MSDEQARPAVVTIAEQADILDNLIRHCTMMDGAVAAETWHLFRAEDVEQLKLIRDRLVRLAPYEHKIRKLVTGR